MALMTLSTDQGPAANAVSPMPAPAIETHDLAKRYGDTIALAGLTMTVPRGEVFGFLGPNGAGKTTAVKLLLGLARATGGRGQVLGAPIGDLAARRRIGYLPELFRYQSWLRASEVLRAHCELAGLPAEARPREIEAVLQLVGLTERGNDRVGAFSKGMQQRLGLAVALLGEPEVVFLDEPTSALDPVGRADVRAIIRHLRERGATVFLNSHLLGEVERVCDRVAIVDRGRVIAEGQIDELLGARSLRVRATGLEDGDRSSLARFGPLTVDGDWLTIRPIEPEVVPEVVATIVAAGGRVHVVEPGRATLEDRFLALLQVEEPPPTEPKP
jgi:ABC-2 type transport system ATP-binding protein